MPPAAESTRKNNLPFAGLMSCEGSCSGSYGPSRTALSAGALSAPAIMNKTAAELFTGDHEQNRSGVVGDRRGAGDAFGIQLADPSAHNQPTIIAQRGGSGKERKRVAFVAHAEHHEVEAGKFAGLEGELSFEDVLVVERGFFGVCKFGLDAENLFRLDGRFGNEGFVDHAVVAVGMVGRNVAFIAEEELHFVEREPGAEGFGDEERMERFRS